MVGDLAQGFDHPHAVLFRNEFVALRRAGRAQIAGQGIKAHQRMRRPHGQNDTTGLGQFDYLGPALGGSVQQVGAIGLNLRRRIDREGPLVPGIVVAGKGWTNAVAGHGGPLGLAAGNIQGRQAAFLGDLPDMGMIDHDQIILPRQFLDGKGLEILQAALVPDDLHGSGGGDHRIKAAWVVPGHALQSNQSPNSARILALCSPINGAARWVRAR